VAPLTGCPIRPSRTGGEGNRASDFHPRPEEYCMPAKKTPATDLTTPENVKKGQDVYARITPGQNVTAELDKAYSRKKR
jgi:hypothetical protein